MSLSNVHVLIVVSWNYAHLFVNHCYCFRTQNIVNFDDNFVVVVVLKLHFWCFTLRQNIHLCKLYGVCKVMMPRFLFVFFDLLNACMNKLFLISVWSNAQSVSLRYACICRVSQKYHQCFVIVPWIWSQPWPLIDIFICLVCMCIVYDFLFIFLIRAALL